VYVVVKAANMAVKALLDGVIFVVVAVISLSERYKNKHFLLFVEIYLLLHLDCPSFPNKTIK
jgi:hypothetical protein